MTAISERTTPVPVRIDHHALHRYLYRRTDSFGRYRMNVKALSVELELGYANLSSVLQRMARDGRLRRLSGSTYRAKVYYVEDPAAWG